ncbi:hypothetical protein PGB90_004319 [Kerria lacca]
MGHDVNRGSEYHRIRHIVYHKLSMFELSVLSSIVKSMKTVPRRVKKRLIWFFPFSASYLLMDWAINENERSHRKNPKDFENDV